MQNEELTITARDDHAGTQKAYSIHQVKPEKPWYEIAQASADLQARDRGPTPISVRKILRWCRTACRLGVERYWQRRQLREMDDRQLKDIGITREQAEQEAGKPIWKG
jgi:uncharacterized protein YjiS (DUF1127 family)